MPILCLTATAGTKIRKKIIKMLNMTAVKTVRMSPDKENVKYVIERAKPDLEVTFGWLINAIHEKKEHSEKTVVFCQSFKECGDVYDLFQHFIPSGCNSFVAMFHSKTPQEIKEHVLSDLMSENGRIRLVIATSALGMGVNIPNIKRVIIYGVPENMESYLQAIGRGGRDGSFVLSVMYYHGYHLCHCDPSMRAFVKNKTKCRHEEIVKFFNEKTKKPVIAHMCCDVCAETCGCGSCPDEVFKGTFDVEFDTRARASLQRQVTDDERQTFKDVVKDLAKGFQSSISVLGVCFKDSLTDDVIAELAGDLEHLFSVGYILHNFPIFNETLAAEIFIVVNDIFNDLKESEYVMASNEQDQCDYEQLLLSVPEQSPPDDSDDSDTDIC